MKRQMAAWFAAGVAVGVVAMLLAMGPVVNWQRRVLLQSWDQDARSWSDQCDRAMDRGIETGRRLERMEMLAAAQDGNLVR